MRGRGRWPYRRSAVTAQQEAEMPSVSKDKVATKVTWDGVDIDHADLEGGYAVCFERHTADADLAPLFRGLPEDRAQLPRWGYVIEGRIGFRFADREEIYRRVRRTTLEPPTRRSTSRALRSSNSAPPRSSTRRSRWC